MMLDPALPPSALRLEVISTLRTMHSMKGCMPDGQWEDGPEDLFSGLLTRTRELGRAPSVEEFDWHGAAETLRENIAWWA